MSPPVIYVLYGIYTTYSLKIVQVYAPTSTHEESEREDFYQVKTTALHQNLGHYTMLRGDF